MALPFHHNAKPGTFEKARFLKKVQTEAESELWKYLRNKKLSGFKFRRQHPICCYIVDFYCDTCKLVVEVDGEIHKRFDNPEYDKIRTEDLNNLGLKVIRFKNKEVMESIDKVLEEIKYHLSGSSEN
jgi:very-short-patch-repair endonuclease